VTVLYGAGGSGADHRVYNNIVVNSLSFGKSPLEALGSNGALRDGAWNDGGPTQRLNSDPQHDCTYTGL